MLWFLVWTTLVVGTLVGAFFLLRDLYRKGKALVLELERAADLMSQVVDRAEQLEQAAREAHPVQPVDLADPEPARARHALTAAARQRRRAAAAARHQDTYARWRAFSR